MIHHKQRDRNDVVNNVHVCGCDVSWGRAGGRPFRGKYILILCNLYCFTKEIVEDEEESIYISTLNWGSTAYSWAAVRHPCALFRPSEELERALKAIGVTMMPGVVVRGIAEIGFVTFLLCSLVLLVR